jgi:hypothetical protein
VGYKRTFTEYINSTALVACLFCVLGSAIAATVSPNHTMVADHQAANTNAYELLIAGRILMGLGSIVIETSQNKLYAHWFSGSTLAFVVALDLSWNSVTAIISRLSAVPMSRINGWYGWALWIPCIICVCCTGIVLGYILFERSIPRTYRPKRGYEVEAVQGMKRWKFAIRTVTQL